MFEAARRLAASRGLLVGLMVLSTGGVHQWIDLCNLGRLPSIHVPAHCCLASSMHCCSNVLQAIASPLCCYHSPCLYWLASVVANTGDGRLCCSAPGSPVVSSLPWAARFHGSAAMPTPCCSEYVYGQRAQQSKATPGSPGVGSLPLAACGALKVIARNSSGASWGGLKSSCSRSVATWKPARPPAGGCR